MESIHSFSESRFISVEGVSSWIKELEECSAQFQSEFNHAGSPNSGTQPRLAECANELESNVMRIVEECSEVTSLGNADLDAYLRHLKEELDIAESESAKISKEIEFLNRKHIEDYIQLESDLGGVKCLFEYMQPQILEEEKETPHPDVTLLSSEKNSVETRKMNYKVEHLEESLISLRSYDDLLQRLEAIKCIEDLFSNVEVLDFDGTNVHLLVRSFLHETMGNSAESHEIQHELMMEVDSNSMELISVKIFPNDVYVDELVLAATSFRNSVPHLAFSDLRNPVEWFVGKVQERIVKCAMRQSIVKRITSNSRYSCKYVDKEESVVVYLPSEIDASIKVGQGWPSLKEPLTLISLKGSSKITSDLFCIVKESLSALDAKYQGDLLTCINAIDDALSLQIRT